MSNTEEHSFEFEGKSYTWSRQSPLFGSTYFRQLLSDEIARAASMKQLFTSETTTTRDKYLHMFMYLLDKLAESKTEGLSSDIELPKLSTDDGDKTVLITRLDVVSFWFVLFNYGHLKDTRGIERYIHYQLWRKCKNRSGIPDQKEIKVGNTNTSPAHASAEKIKQEVNGKNSKVINVFLRRFPEEYLDYSWNIIYFGQWQLFHHILAVWRIINEVDSEEDVQVKFKGESEYRSMKLKTLLLRLMELFARQKNWEKISKEMMIFSTLRMYAYLIIDPPRTSIMKINLEEFVTYLKTERFSIMKLYNELDLRGKQGYDQNDYYLNTVCMDPTYVKQHLICIQTLKKLIQSGHFNENVEANYKAELLHPQNQLQTVLSSKFLQLFFKESINTINLKGIKIPQLTYTFSLLLPDAKRGDFETFKSLSDRWQTKVEQEKKAEKKKLKSEPRKLESPVLESESSFNASSVDINQSTGEIPIFKRSKVLKPDPGLKFYVLQWMGSVKKDAFTQCYMYFASVPEFYKNMTDVAEMWTKRYGSMYDGIRKMFRIHPLPISLGTSSFPVWLFAKTVRSTAGLEMIPSLHASGYTPELTWTICNGYSEALKSLADCTACIERDVQLGNKAKEFKYEPFGMSQAFHQRTAQTDHSAVFFILWGGLEIVQMNTGKMKEFDFCWIKVLPGGATMYFGEYKSGREDACEAITAKWIDLEIANGETTGDKNCAVTEFRYRNKAENVEHYDQYANLVKTLKSVESKASSNEKVLKSHTVILEQLLDLVQKGNSNKSSSDE
jgi:hypothetical protein